MDALRSLGRATDAFSPTRVEFRKYSAFNTLCCGILLAFSSGIIVFGILDLITSPSAYEVHHDPIKTDNVVLPVRITAGCSSTGSCGTASIVFDYSSDAGCKTVTAGNVTSTAPTYNIIQSPQSLCYSPSMKPTSSGISTQLEHYAKVVFSNIQGSAYGEVTLESIFTDGPLQEVITIRANEGKSVLLEARGNYTQYTTVKSGSRTMYDAVAKSVDYTGALGTGKTSAEVYFTLSQFVTVMKPEKLFLAHPLHTIAMIGGSIGLAYIVIKLCLGLTIHPLLRK